MSKIIKTLSLLMIFLSICILSNAMSGEVNVDATRIRTEANTSSEIVDTIYKTDVVEIIGDSGEWYQISYKNNKGFVKKEYLTVTNDNNASNTEENNQTSTKENEEKTVVSSDNINLTYDVELRSAPSFVSRKFHKVAAGTNLQKIGVVKGWIQVSDGINAGWIADQRLQTPVAVVDLSSNNTKVEENTNTVTTENTENTENTTANETNNETEKTNSSVKQGVVTVEIANIREQASSSADIIGSLSENDVVTIQAEDGDWYKISSGNVTGYVNKKLIDTANVSSRSLNGSRIQEENNAIEATSVDDTQAPKAVNDKVNEAIQKPVVTATSTGRGEEVVAFAQQFMGYNYVSGGKRPETGFDCSGFTQYVFSNFGVSLGGSAASQQSAGTEVSRDKLQPGDLLLFYDDGKTKIGHVGIYVGDGVFIHSANPKRGVVKDNLNTSTYYNTRYVGARRLV